MNEPSLYRLCDGTCPSCQRMGYEHHYVPVEPDSIITTDGKVPVFVGLEAGTYLLFERPGAGIGGTDGR